MLADVGFGLTMNPNFFRITPFLATHLFNDQILCSNVAFYVINRRLLRDLVTMRTGFVVPLDRRRLQALFHIDKFIIIFVGFLLNLRFYC